MQIGADEHLLDRTQFAYYTTHEFHKLNEKINLKQKK